MAVTGEARVAMAATGAETVSTSLEDRTRRLLTAGQRRLDRAHVRAGIERLAGNEDAVTIRPAQDRQRHAGPRGGVGVSAACEPVPAPVDRPRCDKVRPEA